MAGDTQITVVGNCVSEPELRFTPSGAAVANFTVASTPRSFDRQTNEWKDQETLFLRCSIWRDAAENVAETLTKGTRVIVQGRLKQRSYEHKDGGTRTVVEMEADEVGPSLRYASAKVTKTERAQQQGGNQSGWGNQPQQGGWGGQQQPSGPQQGQPDPWATQQPQGQQQPAQQGGGWNANTQGNGPGFDEPPY